jgi:hypothetical protein
MNWIPDNWPQRFPGDRNIGGYDGDWWRWWMTRGEQRVFTVVKAPERVLKRTGLLSERTERAVATKGFSEVERYLRDDVPPRVIQLNTGRDPVVIHQR